MTPSSSPAPAPEYSPALHRFSLLTAAATFFLIAAGGLVTSTGSALSVPDWPLAFGEVFPPMVDGIFFEHGHRMIATGVGALVTLLMIWLWRVEKRRWVRGLGVLAFLAVVVQGLLGGLTVLLRLPLAVSLAHACVAQSFLCLCVILAVVTSRAWLTQPSPSKAVSAWPDLVSLSSALTAFVFLQLFLGALVRHTGSGVAIPDFPLAFGRLLPPVLEGQILIAFFHRLGAILVGFYVFWFSIRVFSVHRREPMLFRSAVGLLVLFSVQVGLGGWTVLSELSVFPATAHVVTGAMVLGLAVHATLWSYHRVRRGQESQPAGTLKEMGTRPSTSSTQWVS